MLMLKLFSIESIRLTRRALLWVTLAACALSTGYGAQNFYTSSAVELSRGTLAMPGFSFDLAMALDQIMLIAQPLLVVMAAVMLGNDYSQRTNQHWLRRAGRPASLLVKFGLLVLVSFVIHLLTLLVAGGIGWYFKSQVYTAFSLDNVNGWATLAALFYMTLVTLPYLALTLLLTVATRRTFTSLVIGLGYTQFVEILLNSIFYGDVWTQWLPRNLYLSATYHLNWIGNKLVETPAHLMVPQAAFWAAASYVLILLSAAIWLYRRQDLGS